MPKISIIVPVYNVEEYLNRCIDSILNQTFQDFELILVNDGSTDNSGQICDNYAIRDKRIRVIHKENGGVSLARNKGLDIARGKYVQFIDSDDYIEKDMLDKVYNTMLKENSDIIFWGFKLYTNDMKFTKKHVYHGEDTLNKDKNLNLINLYKKDLFGYICCKLFKLEIIKKYNIRFKEKMSFLEDEEFTCQYCRYIENICILDDSPYIYIDYKDSDRITLSNSNKHMDIYTRDMVFKSWKDMLYEKNSEEYYKDFLLDKYIKIFYNLICHTIWRDSNIKEKKIELDILCKTHIFIYLKENVISNKDKLMLRIINTKSILLFKIYNRLVNIK